MKCFVPCRINGHWCVRSSAPVHTLSYSTQGCISAPSLQSHEAHEQKMYAKEEQLISNEKKALDEGRPHLTA